MGPIGRSQIQELKDKLATLTSIGVPNSQGEMVLVTDACDIGGGPTLFQWQQLDKAQIPHQFHTSGMAPDGKFVHNYLEMERDTKKL